MPAPIQAPVQIQPQQFVQQAPQHTCNTELLVFMYAVKKTHMFGKDTCIGVFYCPKCKEMYKNEVKL